MDSGGGDDPVPACLVVRSTRARFLVRGASGTDSTPNLWSRWQGIGATIPYALHRSSVPGGAPSDVGESTARSDVSLPENTKRFA